MNSFSKKDQDKKAVKLAESIGDVTANFLAKWKGYSVYESVISRTERIFTGMPTLILINEKECRFSTYDEMDDFFNYVWENNIKFE